jgi:tetratricopeptide (TPR) repeat protein
VAARTSTFTFKGKDVDIRDVGERLKVNAVLDGSVRKTGNGIRVSCQLLNTEDGYELWSEQYDRELADVLMLQEDITRAIVDKLKVSLVEHLRPNRRQTESKSAYHHYLKGRFYWSKRYEGGLRTAREEFERAIADDPEYALAYSGLADTLVLRGLYSLERPRDVFVRAEKHVAKALSIESRLAEAHTSLALILLSAYWDWAGAENEFLRAIELDPMEAQAHTYYSWLLAMLGRHWEAGVSAKRAQDIDPLSPLVNSGVAWMYFVSREYDRAIEESLKCLEVDPNFLVGLYVLGLSYLRKEAYAQASPLIRARDRALRPRAVLSWLTRAALRGDGRARQGGRHHLGPRCAARESPVRASPLLRVHLRRPQGFRSRVRMAGKGVRGRRAAVLFPVSPDRLPAERRTPQGAPGPDGSGALNSTAFYLCPCCQHIPVPGPRMVACSLYGRTGRAYRQCR